jgi:hypothetical protein
MVGCKSTFLDLILHCNHKVSTNLGVHTQRHTLTHTNKGTHTQPPNSPVAVQHSIPGVQLDGIRIQLDGTHLCGAKKVCSRRYLLESGVCVFVCVCVCVFAGECMCVYVCACVRDCM